jgi:hypothetical protein
MKKNFVAEKGCRLCAFARPALHNGVHCCLIDDVVSSGDYSCCPLEVYEHFSICKSCTYLDCSSSLAKCTQLLDIEPSNCSFITEELACCPLGKWDLR